MEHHPLCGNCNMPHRNKILRIHVTYTLTRDRVIYRLDNHVGMLVSANITKPCVSASFHISNVLAEDSRRQSYLSDIFSFGFELRFMFKLLRLQGKNAICRNFLNVTGSLKGLALQGKTADTRFSVLTAHARTRVITANRRTYVKCSLLCHQFTRKVFLSCVVQSTSFVQWNVVDTAALRLQFTGIMCSSQKTCDWESALRDQWERDLYLKNWCGNCWSQQCS